MIVELGESQPWSSKRFTFLGHWLLTWQMCPQIKFSSCGGVADFAKAFVFHPRDLGSNLSSGIKSFLTLFVSHLNLDL